MLLSTLAITELRWWLKHLKTEKQFLPDIPVLYKPTNAVEQGRGGTDGNTPISGRWGSWTKIILMFWKLKPSYR